MARKRPAWIASTTSRATSAGAFPAACRARTDSLTTEPEPIVGARAEPRRPVAFRVAVRRGKRP
jgi:hypothetical protein